MSRYFKNIFFIIFSFFILHLSALAQNASLKGRTINACEDDAEWPPYTYYQRDKLNQPTQKPIGFSVDVSSQILAKVGVIFKPSLIPWVHCKDQVEKGETYQFALNATSSPERLKAFYFSDPIYQTTSTYFYVKKYHPKGLFIKNLADLKNYSVCGLLGYNYTRYGLPDNSSNLDLHSKFFKDILKKLKDKKCDIFIEKYEIVLGQKKLGNNILIDDVIEWKKLNGDKQESFHFMISKKWDKSKELLETLNSGIKEMKNNGEIEKLMLKYEINY